MLSATIDAIKNIISIDPTIPEESRAGLITAIRDYRSGRTAQSASSKPTVAACISYDEAAKLLSCSKAMVRYLRRKGKLTGVSFTGKNYHGVTAESLNAFIADNANIHKGA